MITVWTQHTCKLPASSPASSPGLQGLTFSHALSTDTSSYVLLQFIETSTRPAYELSASLCSFPYSLYVLLQFIETSTGPTYELGASLCPFPYSTT